MIPPVIHRAWVGSDLPDWAAALGDTWARHYPGHEQRLWTDPDQLPDWAERDLYDAAADIVPPDAIGQFKADLMRLEILLRHGGLWVDCDTEALRPYDFGGLDAFAAREDGSWVGTAYLGATPGHPVITALVTGVRDSIDRGRPARPNILTGPHYVTPVWLAHDAYLGSQRDWYPYSYRDVTRGRVPRSYGRAYAVHHWQHRRTLVGRSL